MSLTKKCALPGNFELNELILSPILGEKHDLQAISKKINDCGERNFLNILVRNGLATIWADYVTNNKINEYISDFLIDELKRQKFTVAALLIKQNIIIKEINNVFEQENVNYLVFKGADLRNKIYDDPVLRPVSDIDFIVPSYLKEKAIKLLIKSGFKLNALQENVSHEVSLTKDCVTVDLHWYILRPGRIRYDLTQYLFDNKNYNKIYWGLNHQASLIVMLIHPALTKYLNSPVSMLIHTIDLHFLITKNNIRWDEIEEIINKAGAKKTAWCTLYWYKLLTNNCAIDKYIELFKPGYFSETYLRFWIDHGLIQKLWNTRILIKIFFSLAIQDNFTDRINALVNLIKEKNQAQIRLKEIIQLTQ